MKNVKKLVITAMCIAIGIVLPLAFHFIANAGSIILPMHLPVLICGFVCGPLYGMVCGIITPCLSALMTGMPPMTVLPGMICELAVYGLATGIFYRLIKTKKFMLNVYISLVISMILGRCVAGLVNGLFFMSSKYSFKYWITASFVTSLPGIIIQLIMVPLVLIALNSAHFLQTENENIWGLKSSKGRLKTKDFFNEAAQTWDEISVETAKNIQNFLSPCVLNEKDRVLDLACGTGIIDEFLESKKCDVIGLDISEEMIKKANINHPNINYVCEDFYKTSLNGFDVVIVFNAYPHFVDKDAFAEKAASIIKSNGRLYIIHSEGKEHINKYHMKGAKPISTELKSAVDEAKVFEKFFDIIELVDNDQKYLISLKRK